MALSETHLAIVRVQHTPTNSSSPTNPTVDAGPTEVHIFRGCLGTTRQLPQPSSHLHRVRFNSGIVLGHLVNGMEWKDGRHLQEGWLWGLPTTATANITLDEGWGTMALSETHLVFGLAIPERHLTPTVFLPPLEMIRSSSSGRAAEELPGHSHNHHHRGGSIWRVGGAVLNSSCNGARYASKLFLFERWIRELPDQPQPTSRPTQGSGFGHYLALSSTNLVVGIELGGGLMLVSLIF